MLCCWCIVNVLLLKHYRASDEDMHQTVSNASLQQQLLKQEDINNTPATQHYPPSQQNNAYSDHTSQLGRPPHPPHDSQDPGRRPTLQIPLTQTTYITQNPHIAQHSSPQLAKHNYNNTPPKVGQQVFRAGSPSQPRSPPHLSKPAQSQLAHPSSYIQQQQYPLQAPHYNTKCTFPQATPPRQPTPPMLSKNFSSPQILPNQSHFPRQGLPTTLQLGQSSISSRPGQDHAAAIPYSRLRPPSTVSHPRQLQRSQSAHSHNQFHEKLPGRFLDDQVIHQPQTEAAIYGAPSHRTPLLPPNANINGTKPPLQTNFYGTPPPPPITSHESAIYGTRMKKMPPPPPRRSNSTQLSGGR